MSKSLDGKVAVVTGASKGIGAAIALRLAKDGAAVVVNYSSSREGADRVVSEIVGNGGKAIAVQANLSKEGDIEGLFDATKKAYGKLDILVNNAGIYEFASLEETSADLFHRTFNLNVLGLLLASKAAVKLMGPEGGSIINIGSVAGTSAMPGTAIYSATKGAVDTITRVLAAELGPRQIRVNAVNPGMVETEGTQTAGIVHSDFQKEAVAATPLGRTGMPNDIAPIVSFLASADASWITGETHFVSGGFH